MADELDTKRRQAISTGGAAGRGGIAYTISTGAATIGAKILAVILPASLIDAEFLQAVQFVLGGLCLVGLIALGSKLRDRGVTNIFQYLGVLPLVVLVAPLQLVLSGCAAGATAKGVGFAFGDSYMSVGPPECDAPEAAVAAANAEEPAAPFTIPQPKEASPATGDCVTVMGGKVSKTGGAVLGAFAEMLKAGFQAVLTLMGRGAGL